MPFRWNPLSSNFDLVEEPQSGMSDVFHVDPLTDGKIVLGAGTDFIRVSDIDVDALDNITNVNTIAVNDIPTTQQNLGLEIGVDVQAWNSVLDQLALLTPAEGDIIFGNGTPEWSILSAGLDGKVLKLVAGLPSWEDDVSGGDVVGPASSVSGNLASFDGLTGKLIQDSLIPASTVLVDADIGSNVQSYSSILDQLSALTPVEGDLIYGNSTPEWSKLAAGMEDGVLTIISGVPQWRVPATLQVKGTLTSSQIKNLNASPVQILPAPGAGKFYMPVGSNCRVNYGGSNVFVAGAGQTINLYLSTTFNFQAIVSNSVLTAATSQYTWAFGYPSAFSTGVENQPMILYNSNATEISGNAADDNTLDYLINYRIIDL